MLSRKSSDSEEHRRQAVHAARDWRSRVAVAPTRAAADTQGPWSLVQTRAFMEGSGWRARGVNNVGSRDLRHYPSMRAAIHEWRSSNCETGNATRTMDSGAGNAASLSRLQLSTPCRGGRDQNGSSRPRAAPDLVTGLSSIPKEWHPVSVLESGAGSCRIGLLHVARQDSHWVGHFRTVRSDDPKRVTLSERMATRNVGEDTVPG